MRRFFQFLIPIGCAFSLLMVSCSSAQKPLEEATNNADTVTVQTSLATVVNTEADLPECVKDSIGQFYFIIKDSSFRYCNGSKYLQYKLAATASNPSCSIETTGGKKSLSCSDGSSFILKDGVSGTDGKNGADGADGTNGTNGTNGSNGEVGQPGAAGSNGSSCSLSDDGEGTITKICGADTTSWPMAICQITIRRGPMLAKTNGIFFGILGTLPYDPTKAFCSEGMLFKKCGEQTYPALFGFCDDRDQRTYSYTPIGSQAWMSNNLAYSSDNGYYTFAQADQTLCPAGWELPSTAAFDTLQEYFLEEYGTGGSYTVDDYLKSGGAWTTSAAPSRTEYFNAYPDGYFDPEITGLQDQGTDAYYWTSKSASNDSAYALHIANEGDSTPNALDSRTLMPKDFALPVRCVRKLTHAEKAFWIQAKEILKDIYQ